MYTTKVPCWSFWCPEEPPYSGDSNRSQAGEIVIYHYNSLPLLFSGLAVSEHIVCIFFTFAFSIPDHLFDEVYLL